METDLLFFVGEFLVTIDSDHRLTLPQEFQPEIQSEQSETWVLAKERAGALSLWSATEWDKRVGTEMTRIEKDARGERPPTRLDECHRLVRLLSARSARVKISPKGRMTIPAECREFLAIKVPGNCVIVGTGVAIEIWQPETWNEYVKQEIGNFAALFEKLTN